MIEGPGFTVTDEAERDMLGIWAYIAHDSPSAAERLWQRFTVVFAMLARQPLMGESCEELGEDLRRFTVGNYVAYYKPFVEGVLIVRVIHGARDAPALL